MSARPNRGPAPCDFAEVCSRMDAKQVEQHYGIGHSIRERWQRETGAQLEPKVRGAQIPADFRQHALRETRAQLVMRYGLSRAQICRLLERAKIEPVRAAVVPPPAKMRPMPADFRAQARVKSRYQLNKHYHAADQTVNRWCVEAGIEPPRARSTGVHRAMAPSTVTASSRDITAAGLAAEHLRRTHSNVYRADILPEAERKRLPNKGKGLFVVAGRGAMTPAALIDLAKAKGFDPAAWTRV